MYELNLPVNGYIKQNMDMNQGKHSAAESFWINKQRFSATLRYVLTLGLKL